MKLRCYTLKVIFLGMIFVNISAYSSEQAPSFESVNADVLSKITTYEEVASKVLLSGADRISRTGIYPKGVIDDEENEWFLARFDELNLNNGVQVDKEDQIVEFLYWSTGLVSRGQSLVVLKSGLELKDSVFYGNKIKNNSIECRVIKEGWYACLS